MSVGLVTNVVKPKPTPTVTPTPTPKPIPTPAPAISNQQLDALTNLIGQLADMIQSGGRGDYGNNGGRGDYGNNGGRGDYGNNGGRGDYGNNGPRGDYGNNGPRGDYGSNNAIRGNYGNNNRSNTGNSPDMMSLIGKLVDMLNNNTNNGPRGNDGMNGSRGNDGMNGPRGMNGSNGNNGWNDRGNSSWNSNNGWNDRGNDGTNTITNGGRGTIINGGPGDDTIIINGRGNDGANGSRGNNGMNGSRGNDGANGSRGNNGWNGNNGRGSATDDGVSTPKNTPTRINVVSNDQGGNNNGVAGFRQADHGTVSRNGNDLVYTPNNGFQGQDSFDYRNTNGGTATVTVDVGNGGNGNDNGWNNGGNRGPRGDNGNGSRGNDGMNGHRGNNGNNSGWNDRPQGNGNNNGWNDRPQGNGNNNGWNDRPQGNGNNNGWNDRPQGNGNNNPVQPKPRPDLPTQPGTGKVWGDPHFVGANGQSYDIQGKAGTTYNVLSDLGVQVNSTFQQYGGGGATTMGTVGATLGDNQVQIDKTGAVTINGKAMEGSTQQLGDSSVTKAGNIVTLKTPEYEVTATSQEGGKYLDLAFKSDDVAADGVLPKGLWGVSANGAASVTPTEADAPKFAVKDLFDTASYGVFTGDDAAPAVDTKIAAEGAATK